MVFKLAKLINVNNIISFKLFNLEIQIRFKISYKFCRLIDCAATCYQTDILMIVIFNHAVSAISNYAIFIFIEN